MKRILLAILAIILCLAAFSGCANNKYKGPLSCISHIGADGVTALMDMTEDAHKTILSVLNKGKWENDVTNCGNDYEFTTPYTSEKRLLTDYLEDEDPADSLQCQYKYQFISLLEERGLYKKEEKKEENVDD